MAYQWWKLIARKQIFKRYSFVWNSAEKDNFRVDFDVMLLPAEFQTELLVTLCFCYYSVQELVLAQGLYGSDQVVSYETTLDV